MLPITSSWYAKACGMVFFCRIVKCLSGGF